MNKERNSFTLIELLVVIAILAVLSVAVVFIINPADIIKQSRDTNRLTDLNNLNKAISVFTVTNAGSFIGTSSIVYVSLPDTSGTCANLGLPSLPGGYAYRCVTSSTLTQADGTGWIPVNFTNVSYGSPINRLPIDPVNSSSTMEYYTYVPGGSWVLTARFTSQKQRTRALQDNGYDPDRIEIGSDLTLWKNPIGLLAAYFQQAGSDTTATDYSGNGYTGTITAGAGGWTTDNLGNAARAYDFDGADTTILTTLTSNTDFQNGFTISAWIKPESLGESNRGIIVQKGDSTEATDGFNIRMTNSNGTNRIQLRQGSSISAISNDNAYTLSQWANIIITLTSGGSAAFYSNGLAWGTGTGNTSYVTTSTPLTIGNNPNLSRAFDGKISDVRIYNRVLSAAEIRAIYNVTR